MSRKEAQTFSFGALVTDIWASRQVSNNGIDHSNDPIEELVQIHGVGYPKSLVTLTRGVDDKGVFVRIHADDLQGDYLLRGEQISYVSNTHKEVPVGGEHATRGADILQKMAAPVGEGAA